MGPRPDGRGTSDAGNASKRVPLLQWGRDRMAAERRPRVRIDSSRLISFNGAATGWPRNVGQGYSYVEDKC